MIDLPQRVLMVGVSLCLYRFTIAYDLEEATLVCTLYLHKKTKFLKSHCTGYEYFKESFYIVYMDLSCFD